MTRPFFGVYWSVYGWPLALGIVISIYSATQAQIWFPIAHLTGFLNLFNLIPDWQLDARAAFTRCPARSDGSRSRRSA